MPGRLTNRYDPEVLQQRRLEKRQARAEAVRRGEFRPFTLVETPAEYLRRLAAALRMESDYALAFAREAGVEIPKRQGG